MSVSLSYFDAMLCREFEGVGFCFHLLPGCVLPVLCGRWGAVGGCGRRWAWVRCGGGFGLAGGGRGFGGRAGVGGGVGGLAAGRVGRFGGGVRV